MRSDLLSGICCGLSDPLAWLSKVSVIKCLSSPHSTLLITFCRFRLASSNVTLFSIPISFSRILHSLDIFLRLKNKSNVKYDSLKFSWWPCCYPTRRPSTQTKFWQRYDVGIKSVTKNTRCKDFSSKCRYWWKTQSGQIWIAELKVKNPSSVFI